MPDDLEVNFTTDGLITTILIGPPFFCEYDHPLKINAILRTDLFRSVIDRRLLERAWLHWATPVEAFEDPQAYLDDDFMEDQKLLRSLGVIVDSSTNPVRFSSIDYRFDKGKQARGSSNFHWLPCVSVINLQSIRPYMFIIGKDILIQEGQESEKRNEKNMHQFVGD